MHQVGLSKGAQTQITIQSLSLASLIAAPRELDRDSETILYSVYKATGATYDS